MGGFLNSMYKEFSLNENQFNTFREWLRKANDNKNRGFYVGLKNGEISSPSQVSEKEFKTALEYVLNFKKQIDVVKDLDLTDDEFINFLNE